MKTITQTIDININNQLCIKDNLFFDIETTGFSRTGCFCYLIGVSFTDGRHFTVIQWLAEGASDEPLLIHKFCELAENFSSIIHFNGDNFDIPFLTKRAAIHNIPLNLDNMRSIDLFKHAKGLKSILRLEQADSEKLLLLHNFEDICGLIKISSIVSYNNIINKHISYKDIEYTPAYITLSFSLPEELPVSVLLKDEYYVLRAEHSTLKLRLPVITGILKYFYPNTAMHKSIAAYVDSECRIKATKETCYTKKHGTFIMIPSYSGDMPVFKKDYNDKNVYLILDSESTDKTVSDYDTEAIKNMLSMDIIHETAYAIITFFYKRTVHYTHNQDPYS